MDTFLIHNFCYFGLSGCLIILLTSIYASVKYTGSSQERYSPFNHYISELGEVGVSIGARVFNGGLIAGGLILLPFVIGLGIYLNSPSAYLGSLAGVWAAVSCACVGIFPMTNITPHIKAAVSYFRSGLVTVLLFNLAILLQPASPARITPYALLPGLLSVASFASFLVMGTRVPASSDEPASFDPLNLPARPQFWLLPTVEWAVFFSTLIWFSCIALIVLQKVHS